MVESPGLKLISSYWLPLINLYFSSYSQTVIFGLYQKTGKQIAMSCKCCFQVQSSIHYEIISVRLWWLTVSDTKDQMICSGYKEQAFTSLKEQNIKNSAWILCSPAACTELNPQKSAKLTEGQKPASLI